MVIVGLLLPDEPLVEDAAKDDDATLPGILIGSLVAFTRGAAIGLADNRSRDACCCAPAVADDDVVDDVDKPVEMIGFRLKMAAAFIIC